MTKRASRSPTPRPAPRHRAWRRWLASLVIALATAGVEAPPAARAALAPGFVGRLSLDAQFVTGAPNATDIAFSADGRAVVTTKNGQVVIRRANGTFAVLAYPFPDTLDTASEKGLLGVVADPNVAQNRAFYFYVSKGHRGAQASGGLQDAPGPG